MADQTFLVQFNNLIQEVASGQLRRHVFAPWELELLLDIESCCVRQSSRASLLRRYQRVAIQRAGTVIGASQLLRFSDFLMEQRSRRNKGKAAVAGISSK